MARYCIQYVTLGEAARRTVLSLHPEVFSAAAPYYSIVR